ncbi:MAG: hypothetical protein GC190_04725 [Alphaproteobacteria bacterium]|nr:hypothetical protein [Alphaproteobacteria bacterium]
MSRVIGVIVGFCALLASVLAAPASDLMTPYRVQCSADKIYADCIDQRPLLSSVLAKAKAENKRAVVIFGFNTCGPCNALDAWLQLPQGAALLSKYEQADVSIFTPVGHQLRTEVFDEILPQFKLHINRESPYGVPLMAVIDPKTNRVIGEALVGFDGNDPSATVAYLEAGQR